MSTEWNDTDNAGAETTTTTIEDALGFHIEERAGVPVLVWSQGGCSPATTAERAMWNLLLATARTRPTREQIAEHLRRRANDDEDHADRLDTEDGPSADEWGRWYDEHLTVSHQIDGKSLRIEGRPEAIADAVLALLNEEAGR